MAPIDFRIVTKSHYRRISIHFYMDVQGSEITRIFHINYQKKNNNIYKIS